MKRTILWLAVAAIGLMAIWAISCGASSPCQDLLYKLCECETDKTTKDSCYKDADNAKFSADQDTECGKYSSTCTCDTYKSADAATKCPANFGG